MLNSVKFPLMILAFAAVMVFLTGCQTTQQPAQNNYFVRIQQYDRIKQECASCKKVTGGDCFFAGMKCPEY